MWFLLFVLKYKTSCLLSFLSPVKAPTFSIYLVGICLHQNDTALHMTFAFNRKGNRSNTFVITGTSHSLTSSFNCKITIAKITGTYKDNLYSSLYKNRHDAFHACQKSAELTLISCSETVADHIIILSFSFGCCGFEKKRNIKKVHDIGFLQDLSS